MLSQSQTEFLQNAYAAAKYAEHIFPDMAACEAALESAWGVSRLARDANNLFGEKASHDYTGEVLVLPTSEYLPGGKWTTITATWVKFDSIADCFRSRMALLERLAPEYPHYAAALAAPDAETFVTEVSKSWSTDPQRAAKVLSIYRAHRDILA
jgi:flagellum-specific peptidoglycan hydrolase FlgJ